MAPADEHVIEAMGRRRVVIRDGRVVEIGNPVISACPLARKFVLPVPDFDNASVKANFEERIRAFGMCTPLRSVMDTRELVEFGASELLSAGLRAGLLDAVVLACDGAGTVVATQPAMVQGIGGPMSGLVSTCPYPEVMDRIERNGGYVLDRDRASIDQRDGVLLAREKGLRKIAVTVAWPEDAAAIRQLLPSCFIFAVHVTGLNGAEARVLAENADIIASCASRAVRDAVAGKALVQAGTSIPVFAMTPAGKNLILEKIRGSKGQVMVKTTHLPFIPGQQPEPLV